MSIVSTLARGEGFTPPGPQDFNLPPIIGSDKPWEFLGQPMYLGVTKPMIELVLAAILVVLFFWYAGRKRSMVPGKLQYIGELGYGFVRNTLAHDVIGGRDYQRFIPYLFTLFFFILINNLFASIPGIQFPTFSRAGLAYTLAIVTWVIYNWVGIRRHGFGGYLKLQTSPPGVPKLMLLLLVPLEFLSNILVRPFTLGLRLFANMFAGHLLLILFALGGEYMVLEASSWIVKPVGVLAWVLFVAIAFLELLVQFLQAFIFTILSSLYIGGAVADEH